VKTHRASILRSGRALRAILPTAAFLLASAAAFASEEAGAHGGHGIPWGDIVKQTINFAILAGVLVYFLRKPLSSFLKERSELMRKSIEDAANARAEAAKKLEAMDARMAKLHEEIAKLNGRMESEAAAEATALRETASAEIERIRAQVEFSAEQELKKARAELRQEASELSAKAAEEMVRTSLSARDQDRLVKENIDKIEGIVR
jgi:F-type H+-transporting ATPase subunit b